MSSRQPLEVVEGLRGAIVMQEAPVTPKPLPTLRADLPEGTVEYHSMTAGLWYPLSMGTKQRDPITGYEFTTPGLAMRFKMGIFRTADPEIIHRAEGCKAGCELHPRGIPKAAGFGLGATFWRADQAVAAAVKKQEQDDIERLKSNPEQAAKLLQQLQAAGFDLAPRKQKSTQEG